MTDETVLPAAAPAAEASAEQKQQVVEEFFGKKTEALSDQQQAAPAVEGESEKVEDAPKKEKTPDERELARLRRRIDNLTRQKYEQQAELQQRPQGLRSNGNASDNQAQQSDTDSLTLSRAELQQLITSEAAKAAPAIQQQKAVTEHRGSVVAGLAKTWGQEKFDAIASDLDDAFGGLTDATGRPKPAADAIFEADAPAALIEYLADPENSTEAAALAGMAPLQAGRAIAKLEAKLAAVKPDVPQRSNAAEPMEQTRGGGVINDMPNPQNTKAYIRWANEQERKG